MIVMLPDHVRETWFLHAPIADPVDARTLPGALFLARLPAGIGARVFLHLVRLRVRRVPYHGAPAICGANHGAMFGVDSYGWVLPWYAAPIVPLYIPTAWFSSLKTRRHGIAWPRCL